MLIFISLGILALILGLRIMNNVDNLIDQIQGRDVKRIGVYGNSKLSKKVSEYINNNGIKYDVINEDTMMRKEKNYDYIFILSDDDLDNLMMCTICRKECTVKNIIVVCNDFYNKRLFDKCLVTSFNKEFMNSDKFFKRIKEIISDV